MYGVPLSRVFVRVGLPALLLGLAACSDDDADPAAPTVQIDEDARPRVAFDVSRLPLATTCNEAAPGTLLRWEPIAPGGEVSETVDVRVLVQRVGLSDEPCFNDLDYEVEKPIDPQDPRWSDWIPVDAADGSGSAVAVPALPAGLNILVAVQARDARGRVDPDLAWYRNVLNLRVVDAGSR